jgi:hypothetical protein
VEERANLWPSFAALSLPPGVDETSFNTVRIGAQASHHLGKDISGAPVLLIATEPDSPRMRLTAGIRLNHLSVDHDQTCSVQATNSPLFQQSFTVIRCRPNDPSLYRPFLMILGPLVATLGAKPTQRETNVVISALIKLFRSLAAPPSKSIQGLWAELFVIERANDPVVMLSAWHSDPFEKFDFADGTERLEVKSSALSSRSHHFSLEQVTARTNREILIASMFVQRSTGGTSIASLIESIRARINHEVFLTGRLNEVVFSSLGISYNAAVADSFDYELAIDTLCFFRAVDVPCVAQPTPSSVTNVHFLSDLSGVAPLDSASVQALGKLFSSCLPII